MGVLRWGGDPNGAGPVEVVEAEVVGQSVEQVAPEAGCVHQAPVIGGGGSPLSYILSYQVKVELLLVDGDNSSAVRVPNLLVLLVELLADSLVNGDEGDFGVVVLVDVPQLLLDGADLQF